MVLIIRKELLLLIHKLVVFHRADLSIANSAHIEHFCVSLEILFMTKRLIRRIVIEREKTN